MTLYTNIQAAQALWKPPLTRKRFLIQVPLSYVSTYNPNSLDLQFYDPTLYTSDDTTSNVYLVLFPDYEGEDEYSQQRKYEATSLGSTAIASTVRFGCKCTVRQSPLRYYQMLHAAVVASESSNVAANVPIKIIDFNLPDLSNNYTNVTSMGDIGTVRYGRIDITKKPGNAVSLNGELYSSSAWDFRFQDSSLTY